MEKLYCPCGCGFLSKMTSTICTACGIATCSAECHDKYSQSIDNCTYHVNFVKNEHTHKLQGLRNIKVTDLINAMKLELPQYSPTNLTNSKFIKSMIYQPFVFVLQRGFRQYGQPHIKTLEAMEEISNDELFINFTTRLCLCDCEECEKRSPHPIFNCFNKCLNVKELDEKEKLKIGLYKRCHCVCGTCLSSNF